MVCYEPRPRQQPPSCHEPLSINRCWGPAPRCRPGRDGSLSITLEFVRTSDSIARSREITETLGKIFSVLSQAESGQRGYLFTGDEAFLQPRHGALARLEELVARLKQLTVDYPEQRQRVPEVERRVVERFALLDRVLAARRTRGFEAAQQALRAGPGITEMHKLDALIEAMEGTERARLEWLARAAQSGVNRTLLTFSLALLASVASCSAVSDHPAEIGERRQAEQALRDGEAPARSSITAEALSSSTSRPDRSFQSQRRTHTGYTEAEGRQERSRAHALALPRAA